MSREAASKRMNTLGLWGAMIIRGKSKIGHKASLQLVDAGVEMMNPDS